jgi:hypothetical protein
MTPPGRVVRGIRRAFRANSGRELSTRKLWSWTRKNISRAIRAAFMPVKESRLPLKRTLSRHRRMTESAE